MNVHTNQPEDQEEAPPPRGVRGSPVMGLSARALAGVGRARGCVILKSIIGLVQK